MRKSIILVIGIAIIGTAAAIASTSSSWDQLDKQARVSCSTEILKLASKNKIRSVAGKISGIGGDGDRYYGLVMTGTEAGYASSWLCLYDKQSKKPQARNIEAQSN